MKEKKWTPKGQALGEVVCKRRRELGLSEEDMAREIGRSLDYIKLLERGMCGDLLENLSPELSNDFAGGEEEGKAKAAARHAAQRDH
jgi:transcriptional regulator with XRE-family HTH domain